MLIKNTHNQLWSLFINVSNTLENLPKSDRECEIRYAMLPMHAWILGGWLVPNRVSTKIWDGEDALILLCLLKKDFSEWALKLKLWSFIIWEKNTNPFLVGSKIAIFNAKTHSTSTQKSEGFWGFHPEYCAMLLGGLCNVVTW